MKLKAIIAGLLIAVPTFAANTVTEVTQVTSEVVVTEDVDYTITGTTPFTETGSVNIQNTEHAVLIIKKIKPSIVLSDHMSHIFINGEPAVDGENCQVKMYASGAIIMPYAKNMNPLTCYTEANFQGDSYSSYSLGNSGGFMNTMSAKQLNNKVRSFKLKRGYMVTFAVGTGGWGYSRCFIADTEDLEMASLPKVLDGKISSYRIFKWWDAQKKGLASDGSEAANKALNTSWCYDWAQGNASRMPDTEWVPNHIYEDWPSPATCGGVTASCHMKTNNEPGNSGDDHPQTVEEVLANWQNLMRTGMRLCSESSHDGSMGHLKAFIDSIDAKGWRCDILDLHCYWAGGFDNLTWYSDNYGNGRPIWISEWIWGASWNNNGAFGSNVSDTQILNTTKSILSTLNNNPRVERYAYWNSESKAKIYNNGLTTLGQHYASMESGMAYNKENEYIPKVVYGKPYGVDASYNKSKQEVILTWSSPNGDMIDSIEVQCQQPGSSTWVKIDKVIPKDKNSKSDIAYSDTVAVEKAGIHTYRIIEYNGKTKYQSTNTSSISVTTGSMAVGQLQYGQLQLIGTDPEEIGFEPQSKTPYVVMGMISNSNTTNGISNHLMGTYSNKFKFRFYPWKLNTAVTFSKAETVDYLILPADTVFQLPKGMKVVTGKISSVKKDEQQVTFSEPFPEGVTPVVVAQNQNSSTTAAPVVLRIYDVTNTGFKARLTRQEGVTGSFNGQPVMYFAATPGQESIGGGKLLTVGRDSQSPVGGSSRITVTFRDENSETVSLKNPYIIACAQTNNYEKMSVLRMHSKILTSSMITGASIRRQTDPTSTVTTSDVASNNGDYVGWFIVSDDPDGNTDDPAIIVPTGITTISKNAGFSVSVDGRSIVAEGRNLKAYTLDGSRVELGKPLPRGVYVVSNGRQSVKVQVK